MVAATLFSLLQILATLQVVASFYAWVMSALEKASIRPAIDMQCE